MIEILKTTLFYFSFSLEKLNLHEFAAIYFLFCHCDCPFHACPPIGHFNFARIGLYYFAVTQNVIKTFANE